MNIFQYRKTLLVLTGCGILLHLCIPYISLDISEVKKCPIFPSAPLGRIKLPKKLETFAPKFGTSFKAISLGGHFQPKNCIARHKVAILVPFRNRESQLFTFLSHMHKFLMQQDLQYGIYIVHQVDDHPFNRAMLFNVGFAEATKEFDWDCFVFHDIDLIPEDSRNLYTCPQSPRHMSVAVSTYTPKYKLPRYDMFGGVVGMSKAHFRQVNGFSNRFWGWGYEDDDMWNRVAAQGLRVERFSEEIARYTMIKHISMANVTTNKRLHEGGKEYFKIDGLNSLRYRLVRKTKEHLFTNLSVILSQGDDSLLATNDLF